MKNENNLNTYPDIEKDFNEADYQLVAQSVKEAISLISNLVERFQIECDFEYQDGLLYSETENE